MKPGSSVVRWHSSGATIDTNSVRWPWQTSGGDDDDYSQAISTRTLLGPYQANARLGLLDLKVLAFVTHRWGWQRSHEPEYLRNAQQPAIFTLYEMGSAIYGREPSGKERKLMRQAIRRLYQVELTASGVDLTGRMALPVDGGGRESKHPVRVFRDARYFTQVDSILDRLGDDATPQTLGGTRGDSYRVWLGPWLVEQLMANNFSRLDFVLMRRLRELNLRLWAYLQGETFEQRDDQHKTIAYPIPLTRAFFDALQINAKEDRDARKAIRAAGKKIADMDPRYKLVEERKDPRGRVLYAVRYTDRAVIEAREREILATLKEAGERRRVRRAIKANPPGTGAHDSQLQLDAA